MEGSPSCFSLKWRGKGRHLLHCHGTSCYSFQNQRCWMCSGSVPQSKPAEKGSKKSALALWVIYHTTAFCDLQGPRQFGSTSNTLGGTTGHEVKLVPKQTCNCYPTSQLTRLQAQKVTEWPCPCGKSLKRLLLSSNSMSHL